MRLMIIGDDSRGFMIVGRLARDLHKVFHCIGKSKANALYMVESTSPLSTVKVKYTTSTMAQGVIDESERVLIAQ